MAKATLQGEELTWGVCNCSDLHMVNRISYQKARCFKNLVLPEHREEKNSGVGLTAHSR